jgi:hypothetical protein
MTVAPKNLMIVVVLWAIVWALAFIGSAIFLRGNPLKEWVQAALFITGMPFWFWQSQRLARHRSQIMSAAS